MFIMGPIWTYSTREAYKEHFLEMGRRAFPSRELNAFVEWREKAAD